MSELQQHHPMSLWIRQPRRPARIAMSPDTLHSVEPIDESTVESVVRPAADATAGTVAVQQWSIRQLTTQTFQAWSDDRASHLAAALAYYAVFSLAPLIIVTLAIAGLIFGREVAASELVNQVQIYSQSKLMAELVRSMATSENHWGANVVAATVGIIGLLYGATGVFNELKTSMNLIWGAPLPAKIGVKQVIFSRLIAVLMVIVAGLVLTASLMAGTLLLSMGQWIDILAPGLPFRNEIVNFVILLLLTIPVLMLTYKYVPDVYISWRDVITGSIATALLFSIGRFLITLYLARSNATTAYGTAASLAVLLLWVYYSAQVFFLGAEFTKVYARAYGSRHVELVAVPAPPPVNAQVPPPPKVRRGRRVVRSLANVAVALFVVGILSVLGTIGPNYSRRNDGRTETDPPAPLPPEPES